MNLRSARVWRRAFFLTFAITLVSLAFSSGVRFVSGLEYDIELFLIRAGVTIIVMFPLGMVVFSRIERLENAYTSLLKETQDLALQANTDPLTGLLNRRSFEKQFDTAMSHRAEGQFIVADVDYLKTINDKYGHMAGDDAIIATSVALLRLLGENCLIARIGGDEFSAFAPDGGRLSADQISAELSEIAAAEFFRRSGIKEARLSISVGAQDCRSGSKFREIMENTDTELYRKKVSRSLAVAA